ncbi:MAG TPA: DUF488 domain-containing protein [Acetobacteraceae bacterium]|jgi:uncharacterized protein (DUF488 family)
MDHTLWTIGYEKSAWPDFLATLRAEGVGRVLDVRDLPLSRRPGFSKRQLAAGLAEAGIDYVHLRALGTPPEGREANRTRQWARFWSIVDARLASAEAELDLRRAAGLAAERPCALLCYEADPCICHRLRVGEILGARHGFSLRHLRVHPPGEVQE